MFASNDLLVQVAFHICYFYLISGELACCAGDDCCGTCTTTASASRWEGKCNIGLIPIMMLLNTTGYVQLRDVWLSYFYGREFPTLRILVTTIFWLWRNLKNETSALTWCLETLETYWWVLDEFGRWEMRGPVFVVATTCNLAIYLLISSCFMGIVCSRPASEMFNLQLRKPSSKGHLYLQY